jgi:predicted nucleic acid-binding protein
MLYLDTSALLPYYRREAASDAVQGLLVRQTRPVLISRLTVVELASALARWVRMGELTEPQANRIESAFHEDLAQGRFLVREIEPRHFERALQWLLTRKTALRTLDALHLACAEESGATLSTLDAAMDDAAEYFGLRVHPFTAD